MDAHPADLCIESDEGRQVWFVVLERVDMGFRSLIDELLVEFLPAGSVLRKPLRPRLRVLFEPRRKDRCESAYARSRQ